MFIATTTTTLLVEFEKAPKRQFFHSFHEKKMARLRSKDLFHTYFYDWPAGSRMKLAGDSIIVCDHKALQEACHLSKDRELLETIPCLLLRGLSPGMLLNGRWNVPSIAHTRTFD